MNLEKREKFRRNEKSAWKVSGCFLADEKCLVDVQQVKKMYKVNLALLQYDSRVPHTDGARAPQCSRTETAFFLISQLAFSV